MFTAEEFLAARNPRGHMLLPPTTVVEIENTHNRSGGIVFPQDEAQRICAAAREHGVATYLDGARDCGTLRWRAVAQPRTSRVRSISSRSPSPKVSEPPVDRCWLARAR